MEEIVKKTNLPEKVAQPLLSGEGKYADLLNLIINFERGNWTEAIKIASEFGLSASDISKLYIDSIEWTSELI